MKITKDKWDSKAYRWISILMVLILLVASVGIFGIKVNVDAADDATTYTGNTFKLELTAEGCMLTASSDGGATSQPILIDNVSQTIILKPPVDGTARLTVSYASGQYNTLNLSNINLVCEEGVDVLIESNCDLKLNSIEVKKSIEVQGYLTVPTATLNNCTGLDYYTPTIYLTGTDEIPASITLTGTNTGVCISSDSNYANVSSQGDFSLTRTGSSESKVITGPVNGKIGVIARIWPYMDDLSSETFYSGVTYNMNKYVHLTDGYEDSKIEYRIGESIVGDTMPSTPGTYNAMLYRVDGNNYWYSDAYPFTVTDFTGEGVVLSVSDAIVNGKVTVSAPDGYKFSLDNETFAQSMKFSEDDLYTDGNFNESLKFYIAITEGDHAGAVSGAISYSDAAPGLDEVQFNPVIEPDGPDVEDEEEEQEEEKKEEQKEEEKEEEKKEEEKKEEEKKEETPAQDTGHSDKKETTTNTTTSSVSKPAPTITLSIDDQIYGLNYAPNFKSNSSGKVKYLYSKLGENKFTETKPTEPGKYVCRVVQEEYDKYGQGTKDATFSILYLATPDNPYSISGKTGNNGYYVSDVFVSAPDGYTISLTQGGTYEDKVQVTEKTKYVYLKRTDGAMTDGIAIKENIIIDAKAPAVSGKATDTEGNEVALGGKLYKDAVSFTMADEHLAKVTVNGEAVTVTDGKADINLEANNRHTAYKISAEDEAGNVFTFTVDLYAPWMQSGVIPAGVKVVLEAGSTYTFDEGEWATDIDSTVYTGGMTFYVKEETEVTFIKVK